MGSPLRRERGRVFVIALAKRSQDSRSSYTKVVIGRNSFDVKIAFGPGGLGRNQRLTQELLRGSSGVVDCIGPFT